MATASLFHTDILASRNERAEVAAVLTGADYDAQRDAARLTNQIECVRALAIDGQWRTIQKLTAELRKQYPLVGFPENSVSAQLRNLRKLGYVVEKRHVANGLFEYRLLEPVNPGIAGAMRGGAR